MKNQLVHNERGFTLIEVMIAVGIFAFGITSMMIMQGSGIKGNATANTISHAAVLAASQFEKIFRMDYDDLVDTDNDGSGGLADKTAATADGSDTSDPSYNIFWNVVKDEPMPLTKTVRVYVTRQERGTDRTVSYNYIKSSVVDN